eukprot:3129683-Amphidinium_carterae.1
MLALCLDSWIRQTHSSDPHHRRCGVGHCTDTQDRVWLPLPGIKQSVYRAEFLAVVRAVEECQPHEVISGCKGLLKRSSSCYSGRITADDLHGNGQADALVKQGTAAHGQFEPDALTKPGVQKVKKRPTGFAVPQTRTTNPKHTPSAGRTRRGQAASSGNEVSGSTRRYRHNIGGARQYRPT